MMAVTEYLTTVSPSLSQKYKLELEILRDRWWEYDHLTGKMVGFLIALIANQGHLYGKICTSNQISLYSGTLVHSTLHL